MRYTILHPKAIQIKDYFADPLFIPTVNNEIVEIIISGAANDLSTNILLNYPKLKYIIHCCNGINNIDQEYCKQNSIQIFNSPTANINATAEHTVALILASLRNIVAADTSIREGKWERNQFLGKEINECTIGFLGFGNIARLVQKKLASFEPQRIIAYDPFLSQEQIDQVAPSGTKVIKAELNELLKQSDIISLHLPLLPATKHMIAKDQFELMKNDSIIINCSRGGIIDEDALYDALTNKKIAGAALDVYDDEPVVNPKLFKLTNCTMTPHLASMSRKAQQRMIFEAKENFENYINQNK